MANGGMSFEQFTGAAPAAAAPAPVGMSFEDFTKPAPTSSAAAVPSSVPAKTGLAANIGAAAAEGGGDLLNTLSDPFGNLVGKPLATGLVFAHDAIAPVFGYNRFTDAQRQALLEDNVPQPGTRAANAIGAAIGAPATSDVQPADQIQALARSAVRGGVNVGLLGLGAGGTAVAPAALAGATGAVAGDLVSGLTPSWVAPVASMAANLATGAAVGAGAMGVVRGAQAAGDLVGRAAAPFTESGREQLAGQRIANAATDLPAVKETLASPEPPEIVAGSAPTTYQLTGDQGLGNLERATAKNSPEQFIDRANQQNAARVGAVQSMAPADASPEAVGQAFRAQLDRITGFQNALVGSARTGAENATERLGNAPLVGADQQATTLQRFGDTMRGGLADANAVAKEQEGHLWQAIDPDGTLTVNMQPVRQAARDIMQGLPKNAAPMTGEPAAIFGTAAMQKQVMPFSELAALRSRLTDALSTELQTNGRTQTYRNLTQLLDSVHDTMEGRVEQQAAQDQAAVAAGQMSPDQSIITRWGQALQNDAARWSAAKQTDMGYDSSRVRGVVPRTVSPRIQDQEPLVSGAGLPQGATVGRSGNGAGDSELAAATSNNVGASSLRQMADGVQAYMRNNAAPKTELTSPSSGETSTFDAAAAKRYQAARAKTSERHATFTNAPGVGQALAPGRTAAEYKMPSSAVPATIWNGGKASAERVQAYMKAGGDRQELSQALQDYAAFDLRRAAEGTDGTLDAGKTQKWLNAHAEALTQFPELRQRFENAAAARQTLDSAIASRVDAIKAYETSAARPFLGDGEPVAEVGRILKSPNAEAQMQDLARKTAHTPAAREGLKRAVVELILNDMRSNAEGDGERLFKSDAMQTFARKSMKPLGHIFSPEELANIQRVAADLQRANRSIAGSKLPGGSNTAQDLAAGAKHGGGHPSTLGMVVAAEAGGEALGHMAGPVGRIVGMVATPVINAMREAGMRKVDDLVTEAMLNPGLARTLLAKVPMDAQRTPLGTMVARQIKALAVGVGARDYQAPSAPPRRHIPFATPTTAPPVSAH